eukprot:CAMPEP_0198527924 /NCGR_PEP_ID=MMETSP1462-20131121/24837_1 /TAXON_ID=1333877 /ORGANISM="Brandtodinium nutriculum, Strain RCC3387" /LENGTH=118 /DNA_ID=CAMNT_0044257741 /DNA_START=95 /DNA_END=448 /DNA_ORIENTATION=+
MKQAPPMRHGTKGALVGSDAAAGAMLLAKDVLEVHAQVVLRERHAQGWHLAQTLAREDAGLVAQAVPREVQGNRTRWQRGQDHGGTVVPQLAPRDGQRLHVARWQVPRQGLGPCGAHH